MNSSSKRSDQQRLKRPSGGHRQSNNVKEVGIPPVRGSSCTSLTAVLTAVRSKVTKTACEKQLLRNNSAARQTILL